MRKGKKRRRRRRLVVTHRPGTGPDCWAWLSPLRSPSSTFFLPRLISARRHSRRAGRAYSVAGMDAAALIREDAYSSRGGVFNSISSTADLRHQLDQELELQARTSSRLDKGKGRAEEEDDDSDDMGWEPAATKEQAERRRLSGEAQYQYTNHPNTDLSHNLNHARRRSGTGSIGSIDSRKRSILWWRQAGINVLFIGAWYAVPLQTGFSCALTSTFAQVHLLHPHLSL